jgi:hypothetical protein
MPSCKVFKTSTSYMETFQNTILHKLSLPCTTECMHCQSCTKINRDALFVWWSALLANGSILRCEPTEHVLPIIQRSQRYAQLAGRLANPHRYINTNMYQSYFNNTTTKASLDITDAHGQERRKIKQRTHQSN